MNHRFLFCSITVRRHKQDCCSVSWPVLYRATAAFSTCVLKKPPFVLSMTCW